MQKSHKTPLALVAAAILFSAGETWGQTRDYDACVFYASDGIPQAIPDNDESGLAVQLLIEEQFSIADLNVALNITHPWIADVDVAIESPAGSLVWLATDVGEDGNNFDATVLDASAASSITAGTAPFTGCFRPEGDLTLLNGEQAQGVWTLHVYDDFQLAEGTLDSWQLEFDCYCGNLGAGQYPSADVPLDIPDDPNSAAVSTLNIVDSLVINDLDVGLDITHTWLQDLDITLESPAGTVVELCSDVGGNQNNFTATRFDDAASQGIAQGSAPFSGSFRPEGLLAAFNGENAQGVWTLRVVDDEVQETGTLNQWSLFINSGDGPDISAAPAFLPFGYRSISAGASEAQQVIISNEGNEALSISAASIVGADSGAFVVTAGASGGTIAPGGSLAVEVAFDPASAGGKLADLRIDSDDFDEPQLFVGLSGTGFDAAAGVSAEVYIDFDHAGAEEGTVTLPFDSAVEGVDFVQPEGIVYFQSSSSSESLRITKACTLSAVGGTVRIGD